MQRLLKTFQTMITTTWSCQANLPFLILHKYFHFISSCVKIALNTA